MGARRKPKGAPKEPQRGPRGAQEVHPEGAKESKGSCVWCLERNKKKEVLGEGG
jgi:hypothetical protein